MTAWVCAVPWPEIFIVGAPSFVAGLLTGLFIDRSKS